LANISRFTGSKKRVRVVAALMILAFAGTVADAAAQQLNPRRAGTAPVAIEPKYNPHTKSYFELRVDLPKPPNWNTAVAYARTKSFKGVRGRLAHVTDLETHSFLRANFEPRVEAWIGLRYFCSFRKLVWADGTVQPRKAFKIWSRRWHRTHIKCGATNIKFMPVYYLPSYKGFKWQASGPAKYFVSYFVEYPTGKE
jgi:hypothetical protein